MSEGAAFVLAGGLVVVVALLVARIGRANQRAFTPRERRSNRRSPAVGPRRPSPPVARRPGLDDQPRGITSGVYVLEIRHRREERGDVDYLKIGRSSDVAKQIQAHRTLEGNILEVYGIAWTTGHAELEAQVHRDLRPWRIEAPGVTSVELYEPAPEVYRRLDWLWRREARPPSRERGRDRRGGTATG